MNHTVTFRGTRQQAMELLYALPAIIAGRGPDPYGIGQTIQLACGTMLLSKVQQDFIRKSRSEPSEDGITWKPLSEVTLQRRRDRGVEGVDILRDTGLLLRSFSPGVFDIVGGSMHPANAAFQIFDYGLGFVTVGTNRFPWHHTGTANGRLPARPFWPPDGNLPAIWWEDIIDTGAGALFYALIHVFSSGRL